MLNVGVEMRVKEKRRKKFFILKKKQNGKSLILPFFSLCSFFSLKRKVGMHEYREREMKGMNIST